MGKRKQSRQDRCDELAWKVIRKVYESVNEEVAPIYLEYLKHLRDEFDREIADWEAKLPKK